MAPSGKPIFALRARRAYIPRTKEEQVLPRIERPRGRKPTLRDERITMAHGAGGKATHALVEALFLEAFRNPLLEPREDQAIFVVDARGDHARRVGPEFGGPGELLWTTGVRAS